MQAVQANNTSESAGLSLYHLNDHDRQAKLKQQASQQSALMTLVFISNMLRITPRIQITLSQTINLLFLSKFISVGLNNKCTAPARAYLYVLHNQSQGYPIIRNSPMFKGKHHKTEKKTPTRSDFPTALSNFTCNWHGKSMPA